MKQCALSVYYRTEGPSIFEAVFPDIAKATAAARTLLEASTRDVIVVLSITDTREELVDWTTRGAADARYAHPISGSDQPDAA